jgi:hypothetical protein
MPIEYLMLTTRDTDTDILYPMLDQSPPNNATKYADLIRAQLHKTRDERVPLEWLTDIIERFFREIERVYDLPNGKWLAFQLWLDVKCDFLTSLPLTCSHQLRNAIMERQKELDENLHDMLTDRRARHKPGDPLVDMSENSRRLRRQAAKRPCQPDPFKVSCQHNLLIRALDLLQRNACVDVCINVLRAVRHRLPAELVEIVYECTLAAEEIPSDPRILVEVSGPFGPEPETLCRLPCDHETVPGVVPFQSGPDFQIGPDSAWVLPDPKWKETEDSRRLVGILATKSKRGPRLRFCRIED